MAGINEYSEVPSIICKQEDIMDRRRSSYLIPEIYESTVDPNHWDYVLEVIAKMTKSQATLLIFKDKEFEFGSTVAQFGCPTDLLKNFEANISSFFPSSNHYHHEQEFSISEDSESTIYNLCQQFYPGSDNFNTRIKDFFEAWLLPSDFYYMGNMNFKDSNHQSASLTLLRNQDHGPWEQNDLQFIDELLPHFKRALNIYSEFTRLRIQYDALQKGLDRLVIGLILFDRFAHPVYVNPTAKQIIKNHPGLQINKVGLLLDDHKQNNKLQQTILDVAKIDPEDSWKQTTALGISHPSQRSSLPLLVTPMHAHQLTSDLVGYEGAKVAVFISDPNQEQPISTDSLMSVYGLSKSEAHVAIGIANGQSLEEIAQASSRSVHTIRSQLKAIFAKAGVSRQSELIKLLLTGPFSYRRRSSHQPPVH